MMDIHAYLKSTLQQLSHECKRKLPAVREALSGALEYLDSPSSLSRRTLREDVVIRPLLLVCNYSEAPSKAVILAVGAIQSLLTHKCLPEEEYPNILRVLHMQARPNARVAPPATLTWRYPTLRRPGQRHSDQIVQLKVLQTLPLLMGDDSATSTTLQSLMPAALLICGSLSLSAHDPVKSTSAATLRQVRADAEAALRAPEPHPHLRRSSSPPRSTAPWRQRRATPSWAPA